MKTLWLALGLAALTGCGAASDAVDTVEETHTTSLHGSWKTASGETRPAAIIVEQRALSAKLIVTLDGHVCLSRSVIEAEVTIEGVKTVADVAGMHLEIDGAPGFEEIIGNFDAIAGGPCPGQGGWLSVTR